MMTGGTIKNGSTACHNDPELVSSCERSSHVLNVGEDSTYRTTSIFSGTLTPDNSRPRFVYLNGSEDNESKVKPCVPSEFSKRPMLLRK